MLKTVGIILLCVFAAITALSWYAGIFDRIDISYGEVDPYPLIYREHRGSYEGFRFVMNDVYRYVRDSLSLSTDTGFAVFYDNPSKTATDSLRSICGIILSDTAAVKKPYKKTTSLKTDAVVGQYCLRSFFSYMTGSYKFYEKSARYIKENKLVQNGPVLEIYDLKHRRIRYIAPCGTGVTPLPVFSGD